jgi:hypothetical protein
MAAATDTSCRAFVYLAPHLIWLVLIARALKKLAGRDSSSAAATACRTGGCRPFRHGPSRGS